MAYRYSGDLLRQIANPRPLELPDPAQNLKTGLDLRNAMQAGALNDIQLRNAQQSQFDEQAKRESAAKLNSILTRHNGDIDKALPDIAKEVPEYYLTYAEVSRKIRQENQATENARLTAERTKQQIDLASAEEQRKIETASKPQPFIGAPGSQYGTRDPQTGQVTIEGTVPVRESSAQPTSAIQEYNLAKSQGYAGTFEQWQTEDANRRRTVTPASEPLVPVTDPSGNTIYVPRSQAAGARVPSSSANRPPTEGERTSLRFYERMKGAVDDLASVEDQISKMGLTAQGWLRFAPNFLQTETGQIYQQAQRAFTEARLRKDSGAAIPESEFANDRRTYFVQPGDTAKVIEQKRKSRETAMNALRRSAARAYEETYGESPAKINVTPETSADPLEFDGFRFPSKAALNEYKRQTGQK